MSLLAKNILTTLAYYDVFDYPLTIFEVEKYLMTKTEAKNKEKKKDMSVEIRTELEGKDDLKKYIEEFNGFYFLRGRKKLVAQRIKKYKISQQKLKIVKKVVRWLRFIPTVKMIAVTGRVAMNNAHPKSDLDLLIVLKKGRIFTGRILITGLVHILGKRRYANKIANRICLNCFLSDDALRMPTNDFFSASEYSFILPIFGWKTFQRFQQKNEWIKNYKINYEPAKIPNLNLIKDNYWSQLVRKKGEKLLATSLGIFLEEKLKKWQLARIKRDPRTHYKGSGVMATEKALIFWPYPQGPKVYERFRKKLEELGIE